MKKIVWFVIFALIFSFNPMLFGKAFSLSGESWARCIKIGNANQISGEGNYFQGKLFVKNSGSEIILVGTGNNGFVAHFSETGKLKSFYPLSISGVTSLFIDNSGRIFFACSTEEPPAVSPARVIEIDKGKVALSFALFAEKGVHINSIAKFNDKLILCGWVSNGNSESYPPTDSRCFTAAVSIPSGNIIWAKTFGKSGSGLTTVKSIGEGDFAADGFTNNMFDTGLIFALFDANGNFKVVKSEDSEGQFGESGNLCITKNGFFVSGNLNGTLVVNLNKSGNVVQSKIIKYKAHEVNAKRICCTEGNDLIIACETNLPA